MRVERGQSLIETLVALTVIVIGVVGAVSVGVIAIRAGETSELDVAAENLAREGIEAARAVRDFNWRYGPSWDENLENGKQYRVKIGTDGNPGAGQVALEEVTVPGPEDPALHLCRNSLGQFLHLTDPTQDKCQAHLGWTDTPFYRQVLVTKDDANKLTVTCQVTRSGLLAPVTYTVSEDLYNWHE